MKKLILISSIFMASSIWADMDKICYFEAFNDLNVSQTDTIRNVCDRDNILRVEGLDWEGAPRTISRFCRFDREITTTHFNRKSSVNPNIELVCVLYSKNARQMHSNYNSSFK